MEKPLKVLMIEDVEDDALLILREVKRGGFTPTSKRVETAEEMKSALESSPWDLILSDYNLPKFTVPEALAILRESELDIPFIILSGSIGEEEAVEALKAGAHDFIIKGNLSRLLPAINRELGDAAERKKRRQMDAELKKSEERFRLLVEGVKDYAIFMLDVEGKVASWNSGAERLYGYKSEEIIGQPFSSFFNQEDTNRGQATSEYQLGLLHGRSESEGWRVPKDRAPFWGNDILTVLRDELGHLYGLTVITRDITDRKRVELEMVKARETAEEASRLKSEFLANVSHEIRTPLNGIMGMSGLLLDTKLDTVQLDYVKTVKDLSQALLGIINDILDLSQIESGKLSVEQVEFDLEALIKNTLDIFESAAKQKALSFAMDIDPDAPTSIKGDQGKVRQILANFLDNAIKFTAKGTITVRVKTKKITGNHVDLRIEVEDTGMGIPEKLYPRLFKKFSQADSSMTRKQGGVGLGLSICKSIVELLGGDIGFASVEGKGSAFWVTLPFEILSVDEIEPVITPKKEVAPQPMSTRILLVEDNLINQKVTIKMVEKLGYQIDAVFNGKEALDQLTRGQYGMVLMDCQMPEMDGYEATRQIRIREKTSGLHMPVVALTAHAMKGEREKCLEAGMDDYITKPVDIKGLRDIIARWTPGTTAPTLRAA